MTPVELPQTFHANKLRALLLFVGSLVFVALGLWTAKVHPIAGYGGAAFFGFAGLTALLMFHPRAHYLKLSHEGFVFCALFRSHRVRWEDVTQFRVVRIGLNKKVGWNYSTGWKSDARLRAANQALSGADAALPDTYGKSAEELAQLLEQIRVNLTDAVSEPCAEELSIIPPEEIELRVRNRIIECLEMLLDGWKQSVGPNGLVNLWYDFVPEWDPAEFPDPIYTQDERDALRVVCEEFERVCAAFPDELPSLEKLEFDPDWQSLVKAGRNASNVFRRRGMFPEMDG